MAKFIGNKYMLIDREDIIKFKKANLIRIGGITFVISFLILIGIKIIWIRNFFPEQYLDYLHLRIIFFGGIVAYTIGLLDDIFNLNHQIRLYSQLLLGSFTWFLGIRIENIQIDFFKYNFSFDLPILLSILISTIWIAGIINAINWMDGLDGLATGIVFTAAASFAFISSSYNSDTILLTSSALAGSTLGFLKFNKTPAKILMGDGGSYFLGYIVSILAILSCFYRSNSLGSSDLYIILVPFLILFIPLSDMCFVIFKRVKKGLSPFRGDKNHLHYRLIKVGYSEKSAVKLIIALSIIFSSFALILEKKYIEAIFFIITLYPLCKNLSIKK